MSVDAGCFLSALGAGMPYNREKKTKVYYPPTSPYGGGVAKSFTIPLNYIRKLIKQLNCSLPNMGFLHTKNPLTNVM